MKEQYSWEHLLNADLNRTVNPSLGIGCFVPNSLMHYISAREAFLPGSEGKDEHTAVASMLLITYNMDSSRLFDNNSHRNTYQYFIRKE